MSLFSCLKIKTFLINPTMEYFTMKIQEAKPEGRRLIGSFM